MQLAKLDVRRPAATTAGTVEQDMGGAHLLKAEEAIYMSSQWVSYHAEHSFVSNP